MNVRGMARAVLVVGGGAVPMDATRQPGMHRENLLQHDVSIGGREVIQVRVTFDPGAASLRHSHPGDEIAYVVEGQLAYELQGGVTKVLAAGNALFIPAGTNHVVRNVGPGEASALVTYLVRKGRPLLIVPVERPRRHIRRNPL